MLERALKEAALNLLSQRRKRISGEKHPISFVEKESDCRFVRFKTKRNETKRAMPIFSESRGAELCEF